MSHEMIVHDATNTDDQFRSIFFSRAVREVNKVIDTKSRFVHYTTAEAAHKIISGKEFWLRKTSTMNDFTEVEHGLDCLVKAYNSDAGTKLKESLNAIFPDLSKKIAASFEDNLKTYQNDTYITCVSKHMDHEDGVGRLSMWRAYGGKAGVAIVLKPESFLSGNGHLKIYSTPVAYLTEQGISDELVKIANNVDHEADFLQSQGEENTLNWLLTAFRFGILGTKHPGFSEEQEWRIVYNPGVELSEHIRLEVETINGIPQNVAKVPLRDIPEIDHQGFEIKDVIDKIIIGPTEHAFAIYEAFCHLLKNAGIENAYKHVIISDIPLR